MAKEPYRILVDHERRFIRMELVGFWTVTTAQRFIEDYGNVMRQSASAGGDMRLLLNQQSLDVQSTEVATVLASIAATIKPAPSRVAVVSNKVMVRMQGKRMKVSSANAWFDNEADALAWLDLPTQPPGAPAVSELQDNIALRCIGLGDLD